MERKSDKNRLEISWLKAIHRVRFVYVVKLIPALVYSRKHISISALLYPSGRKYDSISISALSCFWVSLFFNALSNTGYRSFHVERALQLHAGRANSPLQYVCDAEYIQQYYKHFSLQPIRLLDKQPKKKYSSVFFIVAFS